MHPNILKPEQTALLIVDVQEAFRQSIPNFARLAGKIATFARGAKLLNLPIFVTEQYPKGLGRTAAEILKVLTDETEFVEKTRFSSCGAAAFNKGLEQSGARQIVVAGLEAHICVNQTVHDLLANDFQVHVLSDCTGSRDAENKQIAESKMRQSGALFSSIEMALFELIGDARHEQFKAIQKLIK